MCVIHNEPQPQEFVPEYQVEAPTGFATSDDGMQTIIRFAMANGGHAMLIVPTVQVEALRGALRDAKRAAAAKCSVDVGHTAVFMPKRYETIRTENFDGVLLAFDRGAESEMMIGLDHASAHDIGKDLRKQRGVGLLLPQNNLVS